jgi:hypothetical protein
MANSPSIDDLLERVPGLSAKAGAEGATLLLAGSRRLATAREEGGVLAIEMPISAGLREALEAAGLTAVLPRGRRAAWRIPPDDPDEVVAVLRAARAAV